MTLQDEVAELKFLIEFFKRIYGYQRA